MICNKCGNEMNKNVVCYTTNPPIYGTKYICTVCGNIVIEGQDENNTTYDIEVQIKQKQEQIEVLNGEILVLKKKYKSLSSKPLEKKYLHKFVKLDNTSYAYITKIRDNEQLEGTKINIYEGDDIEYTSFSIDTNEPICVSEIKEIVVKQEFLHQLDNMLIQVTNDFINANNINFEDIEK